MQSIFTKPMKRPLPEPLTAAEMQKILDRRISSLERGDVSPPSNDDAATVRRSELMYLLSTHFQNPYMQVQMKRWELDILESILQEIRKPLSDRRFTTEQIHDSSFQVRPWSPELELLKYLRLLCGAC